MAAVMPGEAAIEIIRGADIEAPAGCVLQDVKDTHGTEMVGPWGLEPQTFTVSTYHGSKIQQLTAYRGPSFTLFGAVTGRDPADLAYVIEDAEFAARGRKGVNDLV